jgi:uncharacterized protein (DUF2267 family)
MSSTGLDVFDKTLQTTNIWLNEIIDHIGPDRKVAWKVLSTVLHKIRDRLPADLAAHLGAELPLLVRGAYYDLYEPSKQPTDLSNFQEFCDEVGRWLADTRPVNTRDAIQAVFSTLSRHLPAGQIRKVQHSLPESIRTAWETAEESIVPPPEQGE